MKSSTIVLILLAINTLLMLYYLIFDKQEDFRLTKKFIYKAIKIILWMSLLMSFGLIVVSLDFDLDGIGCAYKTTAPIILNLLTNILLVLAVFYYNISQ